MRRSPGRPFYMLVRVCLRCLNFDVVIIVGTLFRSVVRAHVRNRAFFHCCHPVPSNRL